MCKGWYRLSLITHEQWLKYIRRHSKAKIQKCVPLYRQAYRLNFKRERRILYGLREDALLAFDIQHTHARQQLVELQTTLLHLQRLEQLLDEIRNRLDSIQFPLQ